LPLRAIALLFYESAIMVYQPLVSILINNYNYGNYLGEAIDSALAQTYPRVEIIVVDDGSTDHSAMVLAAYADRVQVLQQANGGQASAFNAGFAQSRGEIICFLDADDLFAPEKVQSLVTAFATDPQLGWCFHSMTMWHMQTGARCRSDAGNGRSGSYDIRRHVQRGKLDGYLPIQAATSGLSFRRSLLQQFLPMPEVIRITSDDYLKYAAFGLSPGLILFQDLATQRIHGHNAYTHRPDRQRLRGHVHLLTAYWLERHFPRLFRFSDNLFAMGIHLYQGFQHVSQLDRPLVRDYWQGLSWYRRSLITLRIYYYRLRVWRSDGWSIGRWFNRAWLELH
jgi:glycosyltransferase involved in cell wall biosynthesis